MEAIFRENDVPSQRAQFTAGNARFSGQLGSPGGAAKTGKIHKDHPLVAALPPQETAEA